MALSNDALQRSLSDPSPFQNTPFPTVWN